jgi:hypothetical protein
MRGLWADNAFTVIANPAVHALFEIEIRKRKV